jgi:hypothetical protein
MVVLVNRAQMTTATTGTGAITLNSPSSGYQSFAAAGVMNGDIVRYVIEDGTNWEIGTGTYTASGPTLTRSVAESSNGGNLLNLSGAALVFVSAVAQDIVQPGKNLSDLVSAPTARTNLGLGSIATQAANNVSITGGSITGITDLAVADGGTGASDAATARTNLGLGSIATQAANSVSITGGSITGITDLAVADGGTGASTFTANSVLLGNGTSAFQEVAPGTAGNLLTSDGTTWTSGALPSTVVTTTGTQTLSNKTIEKAVLNDGYTEEVFAISDGSTVNLDPNNGSIQTWTLGANRTPGEANWAAGQSIMLLVDDGSAYTLTWSSLSVVWKTDGGTAPTLNTSGFTVIVLWKVSTTIYGARVGDA